MNNATWQTIRNSLTGLQSLLYLRSPSALSLLIPSTKHNCNCHIFIQNCFCPPLLHSGRLTLPIHSPFLPFSSHPPSLSHLFTSSWPSIPQRPFMSPFIFFSSRACFSLQWYVLTFPLYSSLTHPFISLRSKDHANKIG